MKACVQMIHIIACTYVHARVHGNMHLIRARMHVCNACARVCMCGACVDVLQARKHAHLHACVNVCNVSMGVWIVRSARCNTIWCVYVCACVTCMMSCATWHMSSHMSYFSRPMSHDTAHIACHMSRVMCQIAC